MTATKYTYSIQNDFGNHKVATDSLLSEIRTSAITVAIDYINTNGDDCDIWFKNSLDTTDKTVLDQLVLNHSGDPIPEDLLGVKIEQADVPLTVNTFPPSGLKRNLISINWCDKTTWWYNAKAVVDEVPTTADPERKEWKLAYDTVIDVYHGKLTGEVGLNYMRVKVVLDGYELDEQDPHYGSGGDYTVNYDDGYINLLQSAPANIDPVVSYYREDGSLWIMAPHEGEIWKLKGAESQFSEDVIMNDTLVYEVWAYNPADLPNKVMVAEPDEYKTIYDFINDANKSYPLIPSLGGPGWRGATKQTSVFSWDFQTTTDLISSYGMELRVKLEHDTPFGGTFATGTFYFIREEE